MDDVRYCEFCGKELKTKSGKKIQKRKRFCSQKCHDTQKYENSSISVRQFKKDFGLNKYTLKGLTKKLALIEMMGGKCEICGYDKNVSGFDFHHKDGFEKSFEIKVQHLNYKSDDEILEEAVKCMLLCANCHRELHNPHLDMEHVKRVRDLTQEF